VPAEASDLDHLARANARHDLAADARERLRIDHAKVRPRDDFVRPGMLGAPCAVEVPRRVGPPRIVVAPRQPR